MIDITIRLLNQHDSLEYLTDLLHRGYKQLADLGFRYHASYQDVEVTKDRIKDKECYIGFLNSKMIATVTYRPPKTDPSKDYGHPWYNQPHVAYFGQFTVDPQFQKQGIGSRLIEIAEKSAIRDKATEIALDTAENMQELLRYYTKRGYREVGDVQWKLTNYRSKILSKKL